MDTTVAVIVSSKTFESISERYEDIINAASTMVNYNQTIVAGGSGLSDHVAVSLYLRGKVGRISLYLPAPFDMEKQRFVNNRYGALLNKLHDHFKQNTGYDSLARLADVISMNDGDRVRIEVIGGYENIANAVAQSNVLISFSNADVPESQRGLEIWNKHKGHKVHFNVNNM